MILSDFDLMAYLRTGRLVVQPFTEEIVRENGLDLRLGNVVCRLKETEDVLDVSNPWNLRNFYECFEFDEVIIQPKGRYLLHTIEYIKMPEELMAFVELRSTFARLGLVIPPTIVDGGFEGQLTIELLGSSFPVKLKTGIRFLHIVFAKLTTPISKPYRGKYQGQKGVTLPKFP